MNLLKLEVEKEPQKESEGNELFVKTPRKFDTSKPWHKEDTHRKESEK